jgi:hypothetical protein
LGAIWYFFAGVSGFILCGSLWICVVSEAKPLGWQKLKPKGASRLALTVKASFDAPPMVYALPNLFFKDQKAWTPHNGSQNLLCNGLGALFI